MTDRIQAAIDALDKATPGSWKLHADIAMVEPCERVLDRHDYICDLCDSGNDFGNEWDDPFIEGPHDAGETVANATLIAAAPDLATEVIRLRKWQSEAVQYLDDALEYLQNQISVWKEYNRHKVYQSALDDINRLIAEAKGE